MMNKYIKYIFAAVVALFLSSCCGPKGTTTTHEVVYRDRIKYEWLVDSTATRDSSHTQQNGDTIIVYKYKEKLKYKSKTVHDTVIDTFYIEKRIPTEPEKAPKRNNKLFDWVVYSFVAGALVMIVLYFFIKKRMKA